MKDIIKPVAPDMSDKHPKYRFLWFAGLYLVSACLFALAVYGMRITLL